jgi:hypothetical protein
LLIFIKHHHLCNRKQVPLPLQRCHCHCKVKMRKALLPYTLFPHNFLPSSHVKVNFVSYWI